MFKWTHGHIAGHPSLGWPGLDAEGTSSLGAAVKRDRHQVPGGPSPLLGQIHPVPRSAQILASPWAVFASPPAWNGLGEVRITVCQLARAGAFQEIWSNIILGVFVRGFWAD